MDMFKILNDTINSIVDGIIIPFKSDNNMSGGYYIDYDTHFLILDDITPENISDMLNINNHNIDDIKIAIDKQFDTMTEHPHLHTYVVAIHILDEIDFIVKRLNGVYYTYSYVNIQHDKEGEKVLTQFKKQCTDLSTHVRKRTIEINDYYIKQLYEGKITIDEHYSDEMKAYINDFKKNYETRKSGNTKSNVIKYLKIYIDKIAIVMKKLIQQRGKLIVTPDEREMFNKLNPKLVKQSDDGTYHIDIDEATWEYVLKNAPNTDFRFKTFEAFLSRVYGSDLSITIPTLSSYESEKSDDTSVETETIKYESPFDIFVDLVNVRNRLGREYGFADYASYQFSKQKYSARDTETALEFTKKFCLQTRTKLKDEFDQIQKSNEPRLKELITSDGRINQWDTFYSEKLRDTRAGTDISKIFELNETVKRIVQVVENFTGLKFKSIKNPYGDHDGIFSYQVSYDGHVYSYIIIDLIGRTTKNPTTAFALSLFNQYKGHAGISVVVANLPNSDVIYMSNKDITNVFHELGHVLENSLKDSELVKHSGFCMVPDRVEIHSQLLECMSYEPSVLKYLSAGKLNDQQISEITDAYFNTYGTFYGDRNVRALIALNLYTHPTDFTSEQIKQIYKQHYRECLPFTKIFEEVNPSYQYLAGWRMQPLSTYCFSYYGYIFSEMYSVNLYLAIKRARINESTDSAFKLYKKICGIKPYEYVNDTLGKYVKSYSVYEMKRSFKDMPFSFD
jgi:Zn-dependent oligopeptidase